MSYDHLSRDQLYAYDDGVLPARQRRSVERHLAVCAECRARLARSAAVVDALKQEMSATRAPESLRSAIREQIAAREPRRATVHSPARWPALVFGAAIGLLLLAVLASFVLEQNGARQVIAHLVESHQQLAHEPGLVQMQDSAPGLSNWIGDQMHERIPVPAPEGFSIVGARMGKVASQPAAQILYRQENGGAMSLFMWHGAAPMSSLQTRQVGSGHFDVETLDGETVVLWHEHDLNYACVGDAAPEAMLNLAARVWKSDDN